ncbi:cytochrome P450 [Flammula alnicola]|nr:cytochrome P450 [Flammula alnicola]
MTVQNFTLNPFIHLSMTLSEWGIASLLSLLVALAISILFTLALPRSKDSRIHYLWGFNVIHTWRFFTKRFDFLNGNFKNTTKSFFEFYVLQHRVVAVRGEHQRKTFYTESNLSMNQGHQFLVGAAPVLKDLKVMEDRSAEFHMGFFKRLVTIMHKDRVQSSIPVLLADIDRTLKGLGSGGSLNPFKEFHAIIFQMTVRIAACRELAEDKQAIDKLIQIYWDLEQGVTPVSVLLPWFPSPARKAKDKATAALYMMLNSYVEMRRKAAVPNSDPIDVFLADGCSNNAIVATVMNIIFAGVINTGVATSWAILNLGSNPKWKANAISELRSLLASYSSHLATEPLHKQLASIPLVAWEDESPILEAVIRETLRLTMTGAPTRRVVPNDLKIGGIVVKSGEFIVSSQADAHLNPAIYTNPHAFDPDRFGPGREEDRREAYSYLAWGAGRHPCAGMKVAKLEIKLVLAIFLLGYDYKLVDKSGNYPKALPQPDRNDLHQVRSLPFVSFRRLPD